MQLSDTGLLYELREAYVYVRMCSCVYVRACVCFPDCMFRLSKPLLMDCNDICFFRLYSSKAALHSEALVRKLENILFLHLYYWANLIFLLCRFTSHILELYDSQTEYFYIFIKASE